MTEYTFNITDWIKEVSLIPYVPEYENGMIGEHAEKVCFASTPKDRFDAIKLISLVCEYQKVTKEEVQGKSRKEEIVKARHLIHYFAKEKSTLSLTKIGRFTFRDHATVLNSVYVINNLLETDPDTQNAVLYINSALWPRDKITVKPRKTPAVRSNPEIVNASMYVKPLEIQSKYSRFFTS